MVNKRMVLITGSAMLSMIHSPAIAQRFEQSRVGITEVSPQLEQLRPELLRPSGESHWMTGGIIGTVVGATAWTLIAGTQGDPYDFNPRNIGVSLVLGALIGGVPGALIGSMFPKAGGSGVSASDPAASSDLRHGYAPLPSSPRRPDQDRSPRDWPGRSAQR